MAPSAVFVDPSGRRARWFARACWTVGVLLAAYVALVLLSLVAPPGVTRLGLGPLLPRPAAPPLVDASGAPAAPVKVLASQTPRPSPRASGGTVPAPTATAVVPTRRPTPAPTATGSPTPTAGRPTPTARPTTRATHPTGGPSRTPPPHP